MPRARAKAINAETVTATVFGVDPWGAGQADAIIAVGWRPGTGPGSGSLVTINPTGAYHGAVAQPVQLFLGEGQLAEAMGGGAPNNSPVRTFHSSTSAAVNDPIMAVLADQLSRGM
ncbi:MAG TPA: hypothetical protein VGL75_04470 [Acidothermaceae bacterium]|jgi:hypothetical protein